MSFPAAGPTAPEHYVTCFDHRFLLQGLALHDSLQRHQPGSFLWVVALDEIVEEQLARLRPSRLRVLPLAAMETPTLQAAKANRPRVEYIFTLTPFTFDWVFAQDPAIGRVTYVDADLFFFHGPARLFREMEAAGRLILITPHGFPPGSETLANEFGRFCVQFLTVTRSPQARPVLARWQRQCLASCTTAVEARGRIYGEQKYLDDWPESSDAVHVLTNLADALGPWNVDHYQALAGGHRLPVFYHFHSFRLFHRRWVQLCSGYRPLRAAPIYEQYLQTLRRIDEHLGECDVAPACIPFSGDRWWLPRLGWRLASGRATIRRWPGRRPTSSPPMDGGDVSAWEGGADAPDSL